MLRKKSNAEHIFDTCNYTFLFLLSVTAIYPIIYVALASISNAAEVARHRGILLYPLGISLKAYEAVFRNPNILIGYRNTFFYIVVGTVLNIALTTLAAFVLSRKRFKFRNLMMKLFVFTMMFSGGLIPLYLQVQQLGLFDTRFAIILPTAISTYNMIIMHTAFGAVPDSLEESAKMDGANDFVILFKIILPLSKATLSVITLFYCTTRWNEWFSAAIFIRSRALYPLQLILREILIQNEISNMTGSDAVDAMLLGTTIKYAAIIVSTVPILFVYPFVQKYFVTGVMLGAVKE